MVNKPLLVVDDISLCDPAQRIAGDHYEVIAFNEAQARVVKERNVLVWPTSPGVNPKHLIPLTKNALEVKVISTGDRPAGWNARLALEEGWGWAEFLAWGKPRAVIVTQVDIGDDLPPTSSQKLRVEEYGLAVNSTGVPYCNAANVVRFLSRSKEYRGHLWFDDFHGGIFTDMDGTPRPWTDDLTNALMIFLQSEVAMHRINESHISSAVSFFSQQDHRHEVRDWISSLKWDGVPRIGSFFSTYMGAALTPSHNAFSSNFWVLMVKRIFNPGCQADYMVVLEGAQGIGKTQAFQAIGGVWYAEVGITADSQDFERQLQGRILVEISELHSFSKADQSRIKQIITKRNDVWVAKYKEHASDHKRQGILVGTTNETEWIKDQTGGRRFWPVKCGSIDVEAIRNDRAQLFAEALVRVKEGDEGWHVPKEDVANLQEERREGDAWDEILKDKLSTLQRVTLVDAMVLLDIPKERMDARSAKRVAHVLRRIGFSTKTFTIQGESKRFWYRDGDVTVTEASF